MNNYVKPKQPRAQAATRRAPKRVTQERLKRQALYYLERYNATQASLAAVLRRKVTRAAREHPDTDVTQAHEWIGQVVAQCVQLGLVNDQSFALTRARSLLRGGKSLRAVSMALRQRGVSDEHIDSAFERLRQDCDTGQDDGETVSLDLEAARAYARKRRLGGLRQPIDRERDNKDLAALARRGFGFELSKRVLDETFEDQI